MGTANLAVANSLPTSSSQSQPPFKIYAVGGGKMNDTAITAATGLAGHAWLGLFELVGFEVMLLQ
jgi:hypothetical protein